MAKDPIPPAFPMPVPASRAQQPSRPSSLSPVADSRGMVLRSPSDSIDSEEGIKRHDSRNPSNFELGFMSRMVNSAAYQKSVRAEAALRVERALKPSVRSGVEDPEILSRPQLVETNPPSRDPKNAETGLRTEFYNCPRPLEFPRGAVGYSLDRAAEKKARHDDVINRLFPPADFLTSLTLPRPEKIATRKRCQWSDSE